MNTQRQDIYEECLTQKPAFIRKAYKAINQVNRSLTKAQIQADSIISLSK